MNRLAHRLLIQERMAEVPEVEILAQGLREVVVGRELHEVIVLQPAAVRFPTAPEFIAALQGRSVLDAQRRAKYLLLTLSDDYLLAVHLALWGTLQFVPTTTVIAPETLIRWQLDGAEELRLLDTLGYARAAVGPSATLTDVLDLASLGPEVLDPAFDVNALARRLSKRRGAIKVVLLNQRVLAGLGNRDADESLWLAGIDPRRSAASLNMTELTRLHEAIIEVLQQGLSLGGTQRNLFGQKGAARHGRYVFEKAGQPCPRCGSHILHLRLGGRNTHYCAQCQI